MKKHKKHLMRKNRSGVFLYYIFEIGKLGSATEIRSGIAEKSEAYTAKMIKSERKLVDVRKLLKSFVDLVREGCVIV